MSRFMTLRYRAQEGGVGVVMSWEGYSWLLLNACGVSSNQLLQLLQPFQQKLPTNEAEFNALKLALRRMAHIIEGATHNIASQLRGHSRREFTGMAMGAESGHGWPEDRMGRHGPPSTLAFASVMRAHLISRAGQSASAPRQASR